MVQKQKKAPSSAFLMLRLNTDYHEVQDMAPTYNHPTVEPIIEDSENESSSRPKGEIRGARGLGSDPSSSRHHTFEREATDKMPTTRASLSKGKSRKSHKSSTSSTSTKHSTRSKTKTQPYASSSSTQDHPPSKRRHARTQAGRSANSGESSDSDGEGPIEDHREVLAATRGRLTSPSVFSVQTSFTTATNTSSGSSGSNSTVTQASVSKNSSGKRVEGDQAPPSPAVPDPPDVFAYMEHDSIPESFASFTSPSPLPHDIKQSRHTSTSSASSSFHSDNASEQTGDNDTDRSTSPERSVKGDENAWENHENDGYSSSASAKYEAQLLAAQERQSLHERSARHHHTHSHAHIQHANMPTSQALSSRPPPQPQNIPPVAQPEQIPSSGYDLVAQTLSSPTRKFTPIYRRFEALNHRILLGLQDEIGELEDELKRLDDWDTNARSFGVSVSVPSTSPQTSSSPQSSSSSTTATGSTTQTHIPITEPNSTSQTTTRITRHIHPSSRRHEARYPSDISYSKAQLLQTLQYKLAQYNAHLKSFDDAARLARPREGDVEEYRQFLRWEKPVVDVEAGFLDGVKGDLVVVGGGVGNVTEESLDTAFRGKTPLRIKEQTSSTQGNENSVVKENTTLPIPLATLATALAAAFLVPILTFGIIPNWLGRMTVVLLVGLGVWGSVWQSLEKGQRDGDEREWMVGSDVLVVAGVYGGVMGVVAAIV